MTEEKIIIVNQSGLPLDRVVRCVMKVIEMGRIGDGVTTLTTFRGGLIIAATKNKNLSDFFTYVEKKPKREGGTDGTVKVNK